MFSTTNNNAAILEQIGTEFMTWRPEEKLSPSDLYPHVNSVLYRIQHRAYRGYINSDANRSEINWWIEAHFSSQLSGLLQDKFQQLQNQGDVLKQDTGEVHPVMVSSEVVNAESYSDEDIGLDLFDDDDRSAAPCSSHQEFYRVGACSRSQDSLSSHSMTRPSINHN